MCKYSGIIIHKRGFVLINKLSPLFLFHFNIFPGQHCKKRQIEDTIDLFSVAVDGALAGCLAEEYRQFGVLIHLIVNIAILEESISKNDEINHSYSMIEAYKLISLMNKCSSFEENLKTSVTTNLITGVETTNRFKHIMRAAFDKLSGSAVLASAISMQSNFGDYMPNSEQTTSVIAA